jgi:hypothetical protein
MTLASNDLCGFDNKTKHEDNKEERDGDDNSPDLDKSEIYNPNWTLRKCCSKFLDKLSFLFPKQVLNTVKPYLEENMQNQVFEIKYYIITLGNVQYSH